MVPVVVVFWAPLTRTVSVSLAEVTCCAWLAAASRACRGVSGVLPGLAVPPPPDEQAASRISAAADRPALPGGNGSPPAAGCPKHREKSSSQGRIRNLPARTTRSHGCTGAGGPA